MKDRSGDSFFLVCSGVLVSPSNEGFLSTPYFARAKHFPSKECPGFAGSVVTMI